MATRNPASRKTRSNWRILGLLCAILLVFASGRIAGWYFQRKELVDAQSNLIQAVETLNGQYYFDYELQSDGTLSKSSPPHWLASWVGNDWLHDVFYVTVANVSPGDPNAQRVANPTRVDDKFLRLFENTNVRWIALNGSAVTDSGIQQLSNSIALEKIWLSQTAISDQAVAALSQSNRLDEVALESTQISDISLRHLAKSPTLQTLSIGGNAFTERGLENLSTAVNLRELYLDGLPVTDRVLNQLSGLTSLRKLSLRSTRVQRLVPAWLASQTDLIEVRLDGTPLQSVDFNAVQMPPSLQSMSVSYTPLQPNFLQCLTDCRQLEHLSLRETQIPFHEAVTFLQSTLKQSLPQAFMTLGVAASGSETISKVDLSGFYCSDSDLDVLSELPDLQWLYIPGHRLSTEAFQRLGSLGRGTLNLLDISDSPITSDALAQLLSESQIVNLHIRRVGISASDLEELKAKFSQCRIYATDIGERQLLKRAN